MTYAAMAEVGASSLEERERVARALAHAPEATLGPLRDAYASYASDLALLGVRDADIGASMTPARYRRIMLLGTLQVVAELPIALAGAVVHAVPYQIVKEVAKTPKNEGVKSTVKILGCALLFLVEYLALGYLAARSWGALAGLAVAVACPLAGYTTVRFAERVLAGGGLRRAYRTLRSREATLASVRASRARTVAMLEGLPRG